VPISPDNISAFKQSQKMKEKKYDMFIDQQVNKMTFATSTDQQPP
jgi:hypothetical protein